MKRKAEIIRINKDENLAIAVDVENATVILRYLNRDLKTKKKFNYIVNLLLSRIRNTDLYDKEDINHKCKGVMAMKFFKGRSNDRLYCKELTLEDKSFIIICSELLEKKKSQGVKQNVKNLLEKVASYEYEIIK